jgi:hypothetical protein
MTLEASLKDLNFHVLHSLRDENHAHGGKGFLEVEDITITLFLDMVRGDATATGIIGRCDELKTLLLNPAANERAIRALGGGGGGGANGPARGDRPVASPCTPPLPLTVNRPKSANASLAKAGGIWCAVVGESRSAIPPGDARRSGIGTSACNDPLDEPFVAANDSRRSLAVLAAALASVASARDRSTAASLARSSSLTA